MARKTTRRALPHKVNEALQRIQKAANQRDRERQEYDANPHPWSVEAERHRAAIDERADAAIRRAAAEIDAERAGIATEFERRRQTRYDPVEVESAWRRVEKLLTAGLGIADVVSGPTFDRVTAESVRRNYATWLLAETKGDAETVRRQADDVLARVLEAETPLMTDAERAATEAEIGGRAALGVVAALAKFIAGPRDAQSQIEVGVALSSAGFEPEPAYEDPNRAAERERASLPPEIRDKLDANARSLDSGGTPDRPLAMPAFRGLGE